jgi:hypothetical protein
VYCYEVFLHYLVICMLVTNVAVVKLDGAVYVYVDVDDDIDVDVESDQ